MKKLFLFAALMSATLMLFAQPTGSKGGKFTVASGVQVRFSQGNLQFNVSQGTHKTADGNQQGTFRFAENQYDTIGASNKNISVENYTGWISLFGWGTSGYNGCSPMTYLKDATYGPGNVDIAGTNYDWGVYNAISNGGNKPGLWRTLTRNEWAYLLTNRANAEQLYSIAKINGLVGLMILPDGWTQPSGISFTPKMSTGQTTNIYTVEQWQTLENSGAIFIPKEGYRNYDESNLKVTYSTGNHYLAMSTTKTSTQRYVLSMGNSPYYNGSTFFRTGVPVRLARTVEEYTVTFKDWDGTTLKTDNVEYGFAATPPTNPTREGWTFTGWTASVSGMQTNYITGEVTFTAQYEKYITYTVTFVDGLTGDVISTLIKAQGTTLATSEYPTVPTHEGNAFQGWFLPNGTMPVTTTQTVNGNMTLTARFTWDDQAGVLKAPMNEGHNKFSVSADRQVLFSQGNLQYQPSTGKWQFAAEQETRLTEAENKKLTDASYTGWIDAFTWSNDNAVYGLTTSAAYPTSTDAFVDWGQNPIANGGNKTNTWRTLSNDEWTYLLSGRANAAELTFVANLSDGSYGIVILPDGWKDNVVCNSLLSDINYSANNTIDADDWSTFEAYGALFLPWGPFSLVYGSADFWGNSVYYWSKTYNDEVSSLLSSPYAFMVREGSSYKPETSYNKCSARFPVRLARYVQDCPEISSEFSASGVGCYTWDGKSYVASGDYRRIYSSVDGCDSIVTMHLTITQEQPVSGSGVLTGLFSVSADTQVRFSQGNLQYQSDTHSWRFAPEQFDVIGSIAISDGWEDLFGWSSTNSQFGLGTDFTGDFVDWGENAIANGGNRQNRWRTLTKAEWEYLSTGRPNAAQRKYSGKIEGRSGIILLPDEWTAPAGVTLTSGDNILTRAQWKVLEQAGAVFLPFNGLSIWYWSATASDNSSAYDMYASALGRSYKEPVRLVQGPKSAVEGTLSGVFSVSENKHIQFSKGNMQYNAATKKWQFAESQTECIGVGNENISSTYNGWIDLFGFGTGNNPTLTSTNNADYATFTDWGVNPISNGGKLPNIWRCILEHEWTYILNERPNAANLKGLATVNGAEGAILLPDDWSAPTGINFTPTQDNYTTNSYSASQWSQMEAAGAVFLVAAGMRNGTTYSAGNYSFDALYWSINTVGQLAGFGYRKGLITNGILSFKFQGCAVRLARDYVSDDECIPVYTSFTETACDSYTWNGAKYTVSGNYEQTFVTEQGCDSIVTLFLTINKSYNIGFGEEAEESYTWEGTTYTESGDYTKTLQTVAGCDSVVTLHLTIGGEELIYDLRICGTRVTSTNCSDLSVINGVTGTVAYDPATNTLTLENATLTTPDVTQAIWNQIPELKIIVKGACNLNTPYCIALRIDANTTIEGSNADASLKVRNAGPLDHTIGSVAAGTCYTALATFNNANLIVKDCFVETEGAGGILLQGSSQLTVNHARLTALSIGTPTSDAQWNVMRSFKASVAPVLIDCELLAPEGVTFSTTLGGYTTDGSSLTREKVIIAPEWTNGILPGKFSVSAGKQVNFSQGNLQATYNGSSWGWSFAANQWDYIGANAANTKINGNGTVSENGTVDLFGWSTAATYYGIHNSTSSSTYSGDFVDWGANKISNGGNEANLWRTLTKDEWVYLFYGRTNAATLFGLGSVNGVNGTILLPDNWVLPTGASFTASTTQGLADQGTNYYNSNGDNFSHNTYTAEQWAVMEAAGAVFLPAAGYRHGTVVYYVGSYGYCWAATPLGANYAYYLYFRSNSLDPQGNTSRNYGQSVRLVQEAVNPCTDKTSEFSVSAETSYTWNSETYTASGDYTQTFPMANGCDSIVTLHLTITGGSATYLTVAQAMDEYTNLALENKATSENSYTVRGYVTQWVSGYPDYQNADFFIDDTEYGSNTLLECYRLTADNEADKRTLIVGDYVEATAYLKNYNGRAELVNGTFRVITAATLVEDRGDISVADFLAAADTKNIYHLTGVVSDLPEDRTSNAWKYGNFNLTDATGTVYIYGLLTADSVAQQFLSLDIENEDEVTLKGVYSLHNGNPQIANAIFISRKKHSHEGVENVGATEEASKLLINNQVYILRNGRIYTILGVPANPLTR